MERYIKLNSVGCMLDDKTGYVFPILTLPEDSIDEFASVHVEDCDNEWIDSLSDEDRKTISRWLAKDETINAPKLNADVKKFLKGIGLDTSKYVRCVKTDTKIIAVLDNTVIFIDHELTKFRACAVKEVK